MEKPLSQLNPNLSENLLIFDCPSCEHNHTIRIGFKKGFENFDGTIWERSGQGIQDLTVSPSIDMAAYGCIFHGWIRGGKVIC